jgi:hypothetical protein
VAAAAFALTHALYSFWNQDWTIDEPLHLQWSERLWDTGVAERLSQWRYMSKTPATLPHVLARRAAERLGVTSPRGLRFAARLPSVLCVPVLLALTLVLARALCGAAAGWIAATGVALDPNLAAHGSLVTVDAAYAAATLLVLGTAPARPRAFLPWLPPSASASARRCGGRLRSSCCRACCCCPGRRGRCDPDHLRRLPV